ncbi:MAG: hypothetical protein M3R38_07855 [Actinomycetota bacterium]|nr:hypothetical protein [Actinomycetota bacterium]
MIRTVADFLDQLMEAEVARLDRVDIEHGPTIGDMYEGLSADLLRRAVPEQLGLHIVEGFITDGLSNRSGQVDCMLVRGSGEPIPYTNAYVWPVKDVIAVFEIKKTLYHDDLVDAFAKLRAVKDLDRGYKVSLRDQAGTVDIRSAQRAFAETTRLVAPPYRELSTLSLTHQLIFHTLVSEQLGPVGIVVGYHGYTSEKAFRESLLRHLGDQINTQGYGPGSFPQLMISGRYSLGKANGQPYSARMHGDWWPFYFSSRVNPLLLLLEYVWTRLDLEFGIGGLWGEDLVLEKLNPFLLTQAAEEGGRIGWRCEWVDLDEAELAGGDDLEPWQPELLTTEQFVVITRLCEGHSVFLDDDELLRYLGERGVDPEELKASLLDTGLVAMAGHEIELMTDRCQTAVLPDGRLIAGEDNTGRLTRWIARYLEDR